MALELVKVPVVVILMLLIVMAIPTLGRLDLPQVGPVFPRADGHTQRHVGDQVTPADIQETLKRGECLSIERYYSPRYNTQMILCELGWTSLWGGMIIGYTTHVELTTYAAPYDWWRKVIARDNYAPLAH
jgi:hypothetical protein